MIQLSPYGTDGDAGAREGKGIDSRARREGLRNTWGLGLLASKWVVVEPGGCFDPSEFVHGYGLPWGFCFATEGFLWGLGAHC